MPFFLNTIFAIVSSYFHYIVYFFKQTERMLLKYSGLTKNEDTPKTEKEPILFENKYLEEYYHFLKVEEPNLTKERIESLKNNFTMEHSPIGNIIMYYDFDKESFAYYCDSSVPFRYLEPVARKYAIQFRCLSLYKHNKTSKEPKLLESSVDIPKDLSKEQPSVPSKESLKIHKPKPMRTKDILSGFSNSKHNQNSKSLKGESEVKEMNRYTSMGRFTNFSFLKKVKKHVIDKNYAISFKDFKKMNTNKTSL